MEHSPVKEQWIVEAVHTYTQSVVRTAYAYLKNTADAQDIAQEVFLALLEHPQEFASDAHQKAWLLRVTVNKCKNHLKSAWNSKRAELPETLSYLPQEDSGVLSAVMELEPRYRIPIHLYYYEGYSIEEIAQILGSKPSTIGSRLARGRVKLKQILEGCEE